MKNPFDYVAPTTRVKRSARKEAAEFALNVKPGVTYYSVANNNGAYPGSPSQLLMEWTFTARGRWLGQEPRCGHLTAAGVWLSYGPLHERKPGGLMTLAEYTRRGSVGPDAAEALGTVKLTPAGV